MTGRDFTSTLDTNVLGRRDIEEIYFASLGGVGSAGGIGSYGTWEPDRWIWPGATGTWRNHIFSPEHTLDPVEWGYRLKCAKGIPQDFATAGIGSAEIGGGGGVSDPLQALAAKAEISFSVSRANQVLFWTAAGYWWEIIDVPDLKEKIRSELGKWDLGAMVICSVFETPQGVVGISSRSTSSFVVSGNVSGPIHIGVKAKGGGQGRLSRQRGFRRAFPLEPKTERYPKPKANSTSSERQRVGYSPLFRDAFRVSSDLLTRFGIRNRRLVTLDGTPLHRRIVRSEPEDRVYDRRNAEMSLKEAKDLPISELFEWVSPQDLSKEFDAEASFAKEIAGL